MSLVEHAIYELEAAGYKIGKVDEINSDEDYSNSIANGALELVKLFASQGHSGFSGNCTLNLFNTLANFGNLTPLTDNLDEWTDMVELGMVDEDGGARYQSKRNSACFSTDLKTYYDIYDKSNYNIVCEDGEDYEVRKPENELNYKELVHVE